MRNASAGPARSSSTNCGNTTKYTSFTFAPPLFRLGKRLGRRHDPGKSPIEHEFRTLTDLSRRKRPSRTRSHWKRQGRVSCKSHLESNVRCMPRRGLATLLRPNTRDHDFFHTVLAQPLL